MQPKFSNTFNRSLNGPMMSSESHIDTALRNGKKTYGEVQKALSNSNGVEHLAPSEVCRAYVFIIVAGNFLVHS